MAARFEIWSVPLSLYFLFLQLGNLIFLSHGALIPSNPNAVPFTKEALKSHYFKGRELIPPITSNALPGEPSCEELRAMWRYYKRQSRAELTNEVPRFGTPLFWDIFPSRESSRPGGLSSFAPIKGRGRARLRLKGQGKPSYGKLVYSKGKEEASQRRPMDEVRERMGKGPGPGPRPTSPPVMGVIQYTPPPSTTPSSLQQIREVFRDERTREGLIPAGPANGKSFGRIILGPPRGSDGRVASKPRELMTPFERIRFGHADDLLDEQGGRLGKRNDPLMLEDETEEEDPSLAVAEWGGLVEPPTCQELEGQVCHSNADCSCVGFGLYRCFANQCQTLYFSPPAGGPVESSEEGDSSFWHVGPVESSKLGLWEMTPKDAAPSDKGGKSDLTPEFPRNVNKS